MTVTTSITQFASRIHQKRKQADKHLIDVLYRPAMDSVIKELAMLWAERLGREYDIQKGLH